MSFLRLITKKVRGMQDLLPGTGEKWSQTVEIMKDEAQRFGFKYIRTPVLEHTELFQRSAGDDSDVVQKEMYTFKDKGGRSVSLRPEGTAGALRAVLENGLHNNILPLKLMYEASCYRYEKPQAGRLREFFQFGAEIFGSDFPYADAELIFIAKSIIDRLKIKNVQLEINSIGCSECRKKYNTAIKEYFSANKENLCKTCLERLEKNPMRIFDCKCAECQKVCKSAPVILNSICDECVNHFLELKRYLVESHVAFKVNPRIVRGLDYYNRTVFEFIYNGNEGPLTICGGGRYDGLSKILGGPDLPALGFGVGIERILNVMEEQNIEIGEYVKPDFYIACVGEKCRKVASDLCNVLRKSSHIAIMDTAGKGLKAQMKYADKIGAKYVMVIGDEEIRSGKVEIKNMEDGKTQEIPIDENFLRKVFDIQMKSIDIE